MALGRRAQEQQGFWICTSELPASPGHPFYRKLNEILGEAGFDRWIEERCRPYYAEKLGRPSLPPGTYFRMILIGYFEGIASQRGIAWRCSDSRSLADFLGIPLDQTTPDHSTMSRVSQRLPLEVFDEMFGFVLKIAAEKKLIKGKTVGVDSTTLEANAAMKSIERRDTGEDWQEYLTRLAKDAGIENPTAEDLRRFDKTRSDKKVSNDDWQSATDADAKIAKMKDGTTHLAYKAEHVVDLDSEFVLAARITPANVGDAETMLDSVMQAQLNLDAATGTSPEMSDEPRSRETPDRIVIKEVVGDKGYHKASTLELASELELRTYVPEPKRKYRYRWIDKAVGQQEAVYANRRRVRGERSKRLQRLRSERVERSFAHICETGGARRALLRGQEKVSKRYLIQAAARNLGLMLRKLFGVGTAKSLQGLAGVFARLAGLACVVQIAIGCLWDICRLATQRTVAPAKFSTAKRF